MSTTRRAWNKTSHSFIFTENAFPYTITILLSHTSLVPTDQFLITYTASDQKLDTRTLGLGTRLQPYSVPFCPTSPWPHHATLSTIPSSRMLDSGCSLQHLILPSSFLCGCPRHEYYCLHTQCTECCSVPSNGTNTQIRKTTKYM